MCRRCDLKIDDTEAYMNTSKYEYIYSYVHTSNSVKATFDFVAATFDFVAKNRQQHQTSLS